MANIPTGIFGSECALSDVNGCQLAENSPPILRYRLIDLKTLIRDHADRLRFLLIKKPHFARGFSNSFGSAPHCPSLREICSIHE